MLFFTVYLITTYEIACFVASRTLVFVPRSILFAPEILFPASENLCCLVWASEKQCLAPESSFPALIFACGSRICFLGAKIAFSSVSKMRISVQGFFGSCETAFGFSKQRWVSSKPFPGSRSYLLFGQMEE